MKLRSATLYLLVATLTHSGLQAESSPGWKTTRLHGDFFAEGAAFGDIDGDGRGDIVSGPFWFKGPTFEKRYEIYQPQVFDIRSYSDNFFCHLQDFNADGLNDVLVFGFPAKDARVYLNPGNASSVNRWKMILIADDISHESPYWIDFIPGGFPEIVCARGTAFGYYESSEDPLQPWIWNAVSEEGETRKFDHGMGVADMDADGRLDLVSKQYWWRHPSGETKRTLTRAIGKNRWQRRSRSVEDVDWKKNTWNEQEYRGGAQILFHDVDGDGDGDLITSLNAHGHGLAWYEQLSDGTFAEHLIMGGSSTDNPFGVSFSQLHALALEDIDQDGVMDVITGKRWYAHHGKDVGGHQPPVVYWFRCVRTLDGVEFIPHIVDDDSGVGVEVVVDDLNQDGKQDIISANKRGLSIHIQESNTDFQETERWKVAGGRPQDNYRLDLDPQTSQQIIEVPDGFYADLITAEPDLVQPIAMCFDDRGRIWVIEGLTYPRRAEEGKGKDRILIFEDADGNGTFETRKIFAEGINLASGIEVGFGGVFVGAAPYLLYFPDIDRDDVPDGEPEILLDGWGFEDTHETLNSFTWGPDGWLYGCHGVFTHSNVGKPGTPKEERQKLNAGVWRYHPTKDSFEVFAYGTSNPWGVDFNDKGDFFISACVIPHFYNMVQGGRYIRQGRASHFNPYIFESIDTIADHAHYTGDIAEHAFWRENKALRPPAPSDTSALGGGHAHAGLALYQATTFPENYRGEAFFHNLHGHRIIREKLEPDGSGYTAKHRPGFLFTNDHDFIGVGVMQGPDGALYFSDWHDAQTCHHRDVEIWDRTNGRIFRVRYGDTQSYQFDLQLHTDEELAELIANDNAYYARQAQRILQERAFAGTLDEQSIREPLQRLISSNQPESIRLRSLWTQWGTGMLTKKDLLNYLNDGDTYLRAWAIQLLGEDKQALSADALKALERMALNEDSAVILRYLASLLQRLPLNQRWGIAEALLQQPDGYAHDKNIPLLLWYGLEPLVGEDPVRALAMADATRWTKLRDFIFRRAAVSETGREMLVNSLANAPNAQSYKTRTELILLAIEDLPPVDRPSGWEKARAHGNDLAKNDQSLKDSVFELSTHFGDTDTFSHWRKVLRNKKASFEERVEAIELLISGGDEALGAIALDLLDEPEMVAPAVLTLAFFPGDETAQALIERMNTLPSQLRNEAINTLASSPSMALALLNAVDNDIISPSLISPVLIDQLERYDNQEIKELVANNWTRASVRDVENLEAAIEKWKSEKLTNGMLADGDASRGRAVFRNTCGACHQLFNEGVDIGPNLTGSNRTNLDYVLENVLAPNAVVSKDYLINIFNLDDGRVISGMIKDETPESILVVLPGGSEVQIAPQEITERTELNQSLMPAGLFDVLPIEQVSDLIKYLASPEQVPLPWDEITE
jgi:putative membrane-bound dehydrogenase-like protein